jgi:hypothetical protein
VTSRSGHLTSFCVVYFWEGSVFREDRPLEQKFGKFPDTQPRWLRIGGKLAPIRVDLAMCVIHLVHDYKIFALAASLPTFAQVLSKLKSGLDASGSSLERAILHLRLSGQYVHVRKVSGLRFEFLDRTRAPASTNLVFEGAGATGSSLGIDAIAVPFK